MLVFYTGEYAAKKFEISRSMLPELYAGLLALGRSKRKILTVIFSYRLRFAAVCANVLSKSNVKYLIWEHPRYRAFFLRICMGIPTMK